MADLSPELQYALENALLSVVENASLTSDLDDDAAKVLLDWGMARVQRLHEQAIQMADIENYISEHMRANRKLMRNVNKWTASRGEKDAAGNMEELGEILAHAGVEATPEQQAEFLQANLTAPAPEFITRLRNFCESR
jgi:hypothetical protein